MKSAGQLGSCPCLACSVLPPRRRGRRQASRGPAIRGAAGLGGGASGSAIPGVVGARSGVRGDGTSLPPLHHIGLVVRDCDRTVANLGNALGFGPAFPFEGFFPEAVLENGEKGLSLKGAFVWMGNTALEIVEPLDNRSPHYTFLEERGEGLHHLAYWVQSVKDEIARMSEGGVTPRMLVDGTGPGNDVPWCYLEGDMAGSALIELIERCEGSEQHYEMVFDVIGGKSPF